MQLVWLIAVALVAILVAQIIISLPLQLLHAGLGLLQPLVLVGLLLLLAWFFGD